MHNAATLNFNQINRRADHALSVVLWAKYATNWLVGVFLFRLLNTMLQRLVASASNEAVNSLTDEQARELAASIKNVVEQLKKVTDHQNLCLLQRKRVFSSLIRRLESLTADLTDIAEDLVLSSNSDFRALVADCVNSVSSAHAAGTVGRM